MTTEQQEELKLLTKHKGFIVLEQLVEEKRQSLFREFETASLWDTETALRLTQTQNFLAWMNYIVETCKNRSQTISKGEDLS